MKIKKIVLIGLIENHQSMYNYILKLLCENFNEVLFLTSNKIRSDININNKNLNFKIDNEKRIDIVYINNMNLINSFESMITDEYYGLFYRLKKVKFYNKNKYLIIHNVSKWTSYVRNPFLFFKNFLDQFYRKLFLNQFENLITVAPNLFNELKSKTHKKIFLIPFNFSESDNNINYKKKDIIRIVIPGLVDSRRRNYIQLLKTIKIFYAKYPNSKIIFDFLGKINKQKEPKIFYEINLINEKFNNKILFYTKFIENKTFENNIISSDFILSNLKQNIYKQGFKEKYGITKESGVSYIIYKFTKPGIVPKWQKVFNDFENQLVNFDSYYDLIQILSSIDDDLYDLRLLHKNAIHNHKKFNNNLIKETNIFLNHLK